MNTLDVPKHEDVLMMCIMAVTVVGAQVAVTNTTKMHRGGTVAAVAFESQ